MHLKCELSLTSVRKFNKVDKICFRNNFICKGNTLLLNNYATKKTSLTKILFMSVISRPMCNICDHELLAKG